MSYGKEKSFIFSHIDKNDCRVFNPNRSLENDKKLFLMTDLGLKDKC